MGFYKWPQSGLVSLHWSRPHRLAVEAGPRALLVLTGTGSRSVLVWAIGLVTEKQEQNLKEAGEWAQHHQVRRCGLIWSCLCPRPAV